MSSANGSIGLLWSTTKCEPLPNHATILNSQFRYLMVKVEDPFKSFEATIFYIFKQVYPKDSIRSEDIIRTHY